MTSLLNIAGNIPVVEAGGQSLRFEDGDSAYLSWTPASAGNRKTWTWSGWVKRGNLGAIQTVFIAQTLTPNSYHYLVFNTSNQLEHRFVSSGTQIHKTTTDAVFRDSSAWYHIVLQFDVTQATASDRDKIYVNGVRQSLTTATQINQNVDGIINYSIQHRMGESVGTGVPLDGYLANVCFIDGQALDPTSFGEYDGTLWRPKSDADIQSLTFGTNGFYLPFKQTTEAEGFSTVTYTGSGADQSIEGVGFEPDFVWIKNRTFGTANNSYSHTLFDSVRGVGRYLNSNETSIESAFSTSYSLTSFDNNGFSISDGGTLTNASGSNYVAWCWDAGSGSPVSNTDGSITSTVKANTAKGFSIASYTGNGTDGATIGHGLGTTPSMVICKRRDTAQNWVVAHSGITLASQSLALNLTTQATSFGDGWIDAWDSTTFTANQGSASIVNVNANTGTYIAYCFAEVSGYSSIGSYTGTGASGNSITGLGFKPAFLLIKRTDASGDSWIIHDNTRSPSDTSDNILLPNSSSAELTNASYTVDFDADGFTLQTTNIGWNASGGSYIYLAFADTRDATFFGDTSGNSNNWTPNALNNTDVVPDSPVSGGNFAVANVLDIDRANLTASEGNLKIVKATASTSPRSASTIGVKSGKWYWETRWSSFGGTGNYYLITGVTTKEQWTTTSNGYNTVGYAGTNDATTNGKSFTTTNGSFGGYVTYGSGYTTSGDIIGTALDLDGGTVTFYLNGTSQGSISLPSTDEEWFGYTTTDGTSNYATMHFNFGQDSSFAGNETPQGNTDDNGVGDFYYAPPSGFLALTTGNLPAATITAPDEYFNTVLYTGNGTTQSITGVNFQPDWTWLKSRSSAVSHGLFDAVRGAGKALFSNATNAEFDYGTTSSGELYQFNSDGFDLGSFGNFNASATTYVAWNWLAGNGTVSNTDGSITSTVSANTDAGFSILTFTEPASGTFSIGHGLSQSPEMIFIKRRDGAESWVVWHKDLATPPTTSAVYLNETYALTNSGSTWLNSVTSSVVEYTSGQFTTGNTAKVMYAFHSVEGYSKIGGYIGNGSTDGTFVHCGFRPAFVMLKRTDATSDWLAMDNKRASYNFVDRWLNPNTSSAESTTASDFIDFTSNGFKWRYSGANNASGGSYIFLAFAEAPFKSANAR